MKEMLEACFNRLQELEIRATITNMEKLLQTLYDLRELYKEVDCCGGVQNHPEGRDDA